MLKDHYVNKCNKTDSIGINGTRHNIKKRARFIARGCIMIRTHTDTIHTPHGETDREKN